MFLELNHVDKIPPSGPFHCQATYPGGHEALLQRLPTYTDLAKMGRYDLANCKSLGVYNISGVCASWGFGGLGQKERW